MTAVIRRVGAARLASVVLALCMVIAGIFALSLASHADDPPPSQIVPNEEDFDGDSVQDEVVAQPLQPSETGKVDLQSGSSGTTISRYEGREDNDDGFGEATAVVGDVDGDDIPDVIVDAPRDGNGIAYVMPGEVLECEIIRVAQAILVLTPIQGDYQFGFAVAPLYDYDGDQTPDVRVAAKFLDSQSNEIYRTYIFSGWTGDLLATATGAGSFAALAPIEGDSDYDADVDQDDMDRVMANLGRSGNLTRYDGDVNDDGAVDATDMALVTAKQGLRAYETASSSNSCSAPNCISSLPSRPTSIACALRTRTMARKVRRLSSCPALRAAARRSRPCLDHVGSASPIA